MPVWEMALIWLFCGMFCYIVIYFLDIALESIAPEAPTMVRHMPEKVNCFLIIFLLPFPIGLGAMYLAFRKLSEYSSIR
jgi:hypothetical protein